jgi:enterochelin esterase family protein
MKRSALLALAVVAIAQSSLVAQETRPAAARRQPLPRVRYELGPDSLPREGVPKGRLEGPHRFRSTIIEGTVRKYWVYIPSQYDAAKPACVLVFQDGARAINPDGVLRVPQVLENLIAKGEIPVTIGIFVTPGQRGEEFPESIGTGNPNNRDREYDVLNDAYARMIIDEIIREVGRKYNLTKDPAGRAIGGASSGGICAFTVAWERPDQFRNVISLIGSFTNIHGGHVYPDLVRKSERKPIRIFLQDGVNDNRNARDADRDWYLQNQRMVAALEAKGYDMAYVFGEGAHSDDHGGAMLPEILRWVWRDYPGVKAPARDPVEAARALAPVMVDPFPGFDAAARVDPSGTWSWESRFGRNPAVSTLRLSTNGGRITGTCEIRQGEGAPESIEIQAAGMEGNKLSFDLAREVNGRPLILTYQGIVRGDRIQGWTLMEFNGAPRDREWSARRVVESEDSP